MGVPQGGQGMNQWKGKTAFITGASNGIGAAIATRLLAEGMRVVGAARRQGRVAKILQQADASGEGQPFSSEEYKDTKWTAGPARGVSARAESRWH